MKIPAPEVTRARKDYMDIYSFVDECRALGMTAQEAEREYYQALEEHKNQVIEDYENNPWTWEGWAQQDLIDMYRRER